MKKLLQKFGAYLLGMKHIYKNTNTDGDVIIASNYPLSDYAQGRINEELKTEKFQFTINEAILQTLKEHKGTVEDGKCFLASDEFILGVGKDGKVKPIVDCNTPATNKASIK